MHTFLTLQIQQMKIRWIMVDEPVILGTHLNNPYTISNMQASYYQLYGQSISLTPNALYVRFKPTTDDQMMQLTSDDNLELQDYPMDYEVLQDGDYYQDPNISSETVPWLYSVVTPSYTAPTGITYEVIEPLYIPEDDNLLWENMAESRANGATYDDTVRVDDRYVYRTDEEADTLVIANRPPTPCDVDPCGFSCPGYLSPECSGNGGEGGGDTSSNSKIPKGKIEVQDIRTCMGTTIPSNVPLLTARVVCKRWFKIWRGYTSTTGEFTSGRKFNNKVKVIIKTKNQYAKVAKIRGARLWQLYFPVKKLIGVYDQGPMAQVTHVFVKPADASAHSRDLAYWAATTTHNSFIEFRNYAAADGTPPPPDGVNIVVTNWGFFRGSAATPMWASCGVFNSDFDTYKDYLRAFGSAVADLSVWQVIHRTCDVFIPYSASLGDYDCRLTSAKLKANCYHEFGHVQHYGQVGCDFWKTYRIRIANEQAVGNPATRPYGSGNETNAGIVAVGEMWGSFCECVYTDRRYGNGGATGTLANGGFTSNIQGVEWTNDLDIPLNAYLNSLERFDPNLPDDVHRWIPKGLLYDLMDGRNDASFPIIDQVNGFTISDCFAALQTDITSIPAFKQRFVSQHLGNQTTQINELFTRYHY